MLLLKHQFSIYFLTRSEFRMLNNFKQSSFLLVNSFLVRQVNRTFSSKDSKDFIKRLNFIFWLLKLKKKSCYSHLEKCKQNSAPIAKIVTPRLLQFLFFHLVWFRFCQQSQPIRPSFNFGDEFKMSLQENNMIFFRCFDNRD